LVLRRNTKPIKSRTGGLSLLSRWSRWLQLGALLRGDSRPS
jgi:hypothetical protein